MISRNPITAFHCVAVCILLLAGCANQSTDNQAQHQETALEKSKTAGARTTPNAIAVTALQEAPQSKHSEKKQKFDDAFYGSSHGALEEVMVTAAIHDTRGMKKTKSRDAQAPAINSFRQASQITDRERYDELADNGIKLVNETPISTFSIDVDTASYSNVRRILNQGQLPRHDAVRSEEFINYFSYNYPQPQGDAAFSSYTEIGPSPWAKGKYLLHIGLQGVSIAPQQRPDANLVFLLDVSGSMNSPNKLPLLKSGLKMLVKQLRDNDSVGIVVYAGAAGVVLEPSGNAGKIIQALEQLSAGGSTNGGAGINAAYTLAESAFKRDGINRIILCTDGDFNVGTVNQQALKDLISAKRKSGIGLTVLGFGMGNYNDAFAQTLAQNGNGNAYYIDTLREARKVLVDELSSTLHTIASDVKIQIEFNPATVAEYRLIGYESRLLRREDFNNDKIDAGEIGAGHTVTALYEITLSSSSAKAIDPRRYENRNEHLNNKQGELAFLRLRFKQPNAKTSSLLETPIYQRDLIADLNTTSENFRFAAAVAAFAQLLKGGDHTGTFTYQDVLALAEHSRGTDRFGYRSDMLQLVRLAESFSQQRVSKQSDNQKMKALAAQF